MTKMAVESVCDREMRAAKAQVVALSQERLERRLKREKWAPGLTSVSGAAGRKRSATGGGGTALWNTANLTGRGVAWLEQQRRDEARAEGAEREEMNFEERIQRQADVYTEARERKLDYQVDLLFYFYFF